MTTNFGYTEVQSTAGDYFKEIQAPEGYRMLDVHVWDLDGNPVIVTGFRIVSSGDGSDGVLNLAFVNYRTEVADQTIGFQVICERLYEVDQAGT